jgi:hypothetical protein
VGSSDHVMLLAHITVNAGPPPCNRGLPDWRRAECLGMRAALQRLNWDELFQNCTADQSWTILKGHVDDFVKNYVPERRRRNHNKPPWLTRDILRAIQKKKFLEENCKRLRLQAGEQKAFCRIY